MISLLEKKVDPEHTALIAIDVQNDFCHEDGSLAKAKKDLSMVKKMVPNLLRFIDYAREIPLPIIYVRTTHDEWTNSAAYLQINRARNRPPICQPDKWGADLYMLSPLENEAIVTKHRYSAFQGTNLELILRSKSIDTLLITGVMPNVCVDSTLRDGFNRDFFTILVEDCVASDRIDLHEATLENVRDYFGIVCYTDELLRIWEENYGRAFS
jgi:ureidoacrylate peracid hydrolase